MRTTRPRLLALASALPMAALAHPGHGIEAATHWHATDAWGWALGLAAAAFGVWLWRRK